MLTALLIGAAVVVGVVIGVVAMIALCFLGAAYAVGGALW